MINRELYLSGKPDLLVSDQFPDGVIICELDRSMIPGTVIYANKAALHLLDYTAEHLYALNFHEICTITHLTYNTNLTNASTFCADIKKSDDTLIHCQFTAIIHSDVDVPKYHLFFKEAGNTGNDIKLNDDSIRTDKQRLFSDCSSGVAHDINNSINLITLSSDLLCEIVREMRHVIDKNGINEQVRGMGNDEIAKTTEYLISNLITSSMKISSLTQAFFHFFRNSSGQNTETYDVKKMLQSIIYITEYSIRKVSSELQFESTQGIIKRTGNPFQIQQALLHSVFFVCKSVSNTSHPFKITTINNPQQNECCISISHAGCKPVPESVLDILEINSKKMNFQVTDHPLVIASILTLQNGGTFIVNSGNPEGIEITLSFSAVTGLNTP